MARGELSSASFHHASPRSFDGNGPPILHRTSKRQRTREDTSPTQIWRWPASSCYGLPWRRSVAHSKKNVSPCSMIIPLRSDGQRNSHRNVRGWRSTSSRHSPYVQNNKKRAHSRRFTLLGSAWPLPTYRRARLEATLRGSATVTTIYSHSLILLFRYHHSNRGQSSA